jgi:dihydroxyacetone kinase
MGTFLWTLEMGGLAITLLGLGRERWLRQRQRP